MSAAQICRLAQSLDAELDVRYSHRLAESKGEVAITFGKSHVMLDVNVRPVARWGRACYDVPATHFSEYGMHGGKHGLVLPCAWVSIFKVVGSRHVVAGDGDRLIKVQGEPGVHAVEGAWLPLSVPLTQSIAIHDAQRTFLGLEAAGVDAAASTHLAAADLLASGLGW